MKIYHATEQVLYTHVSGHKKTSNIEPLYPTTPSHLINTDAVVSHKPMRYMSHPSIQSNCTGTITIPWFFKRLKNHLSPKNIPSEEIWPNNPHLIQYEIPISRLEDPPHILQWDFGGLPHEKIQHHKGHWNSVSLHRSAWYKETGQISDIAIWIRKLCVYDLHENAHKTVDRYRDSVCFV